MTSNSWSLFWIQQRRNMQKKLKFTSLRLWLMTSTLHRLHQLMVLHGFAAEKEFVKLFSMFSSQHENWKESNMADRSPMTDISTDVDPDDQNRMLKLHGEKSGHKGLLSIATEEGKSRHAAKADNKCKRRVIVYSWN